MTVRTGWIGGSAGAGEICVKITCSALFLFLCSMQLHRKVDQGWIMGSGPPPSPILALRFRPSTSRVQEQALFCRNCSLFPTYVSWCRVCTWAQFLAEPATCPSLSPRARTHLAGMVMMLYREAHWSEDAAVDVRKLKSALTLQFAAPTGHFERERWSFNK